MNADWQACLDAAIDENVEQLVDLRRHLHSHPEPSNEELETSLHLYQLFEKLGFSVQMGPDGRGVIVENPLPEPAVGRGRFALRADIDALRIQDEKQVPYCSKSPGVMHACGHDAHTACVFGAVTAIRRLQQDAVLPAELPWRAIFQPAEESANGARDMVAAGCLENIDAIFALHVDPTRPAGKVSIRPGVFTANCDDMRIVVHGRGGHGARPHLSNDPIAAAAQLISSLYQFIPRATDSQEAVVVSVGRIRGGDNSNVIPEHVEFWGTLRTLDRDVRLQAIDHIRRLAAGVDQMTGTRTEVHFETSIPSVYNDSLLTTEAGCVIDELLGPDALHMLSRPSMGSEDFAAYLEHVPGLMFRLGCAADESPAPGLHTPLFDIDERCLAIGAKLLARIAVTWALPHQTESY